MRQVTLFTRPGCHLCDRVLEVIQQVARRHRFHLEIRDIEKSADDLDRFAAAIPVVEVDGREIARFRLTAYDLEAALEN
jgi:glutaredoxin